MPVNRLENSFWRAEFVEEHNKDALKRHLIKVGRALLMFKTDANHNPQYLIEQIDLGT